MGQLINGGAGTVVLFQGSGRNPYKLKNHGDHFSCDCPAWRNQGQTTPDKRTCKHLKSENGEDFESARLGVATSLPSSAPVVNSPNPVSLTGTSSSRGNCLLAHSWDNVQDLTGWWLSEKLDGVRAIWDGQKFWSRENGVTKKSNVFHAPDWFRAVLPEVPLDGELTCGRGKFQETISIVRTLDAGLRWKGVKFEVFDSQGVPLGFEARQEKIREFILPDNPHASSLEHVQCEGNDHLREFLKRVETLGGEGVMARRPGSMYEIGRSHDLLKVKTFFDCEAEVTGYFPGKGKYKGMHGGLVCRIPKRLELRAGGKIAVLEEGVNFEIGTGLTDNNRRNPPGVGAIITFRFQECTKDGIPRFPAFVGTRDYE